MGQNRAREGARIYSAASPSLHISGEPGKAQHPVPLLPSRGAFHGIIAVTTQNGMPNIFIYLGDGEKYRRVPGDSAETPQGVAPVNVRETFVIDYNRYGLRPQSLPCPFKCARPPDRPSQVHGDRQEGVKESVVGGNHQHSGAGSLSAGSVGRGL